MGDNATKDAGHLDATELEAEGQAGAPVPAGTTVPDVAVVTDELKTENGVLKLAGKAEDILASIEKTLKRDDEISSKAWKGCLWSIVKVLFLGALGIFVCLVLCASPLLPVGAIGVFVIVFWGIYRIYKAFAWSGMVRSEMSGITDGNRLTLCRQLLDVLQKDQAKKKPFKISCDLTPSTDDRFRTSHESPDTGWFGVKIDKNKYEHQWFNFLVNLSDGNRLIIKVTSTVYEKVKYKKRTRRRYRTRHKIDLRLIVSPSRFKGFRPPDRLVGDNIAGLSVLSSRVDKHEIRMSLRGWSDYLAIEQLLQPVTALYSCLVPLERKRLRRQQS